MTLGAISRLLVAVALTCAPLGAGGAQARTIATPSARPALTIPLGRAILPDGRVDADEWRDARAIDAAPDVRLYLKRDDQFLYVAVVRSAPAIFGVNLYLAASDTARSLNLHASAKLGERQGRAGAWPEWVWWNNAGWTANVARGESFTERRFLPDTAKEFQIRLSRLPARGFGLSLDLETAQGTTPLLTGAPTREGLHWLALQL